MPKKIQECTMAHLVGVPLPQHAATYTVISHRFVIDYSRQQLVAAGFNIVDEEYRCTADGQIAQGIYRLNYNLDPELHMMFAWTNSYNKQVKFKCLIGGYITATETVMTSGDIGTWTRKHTGTADVETKATIDDQIANAHMYYSQLVSDKAFMETVTMTRRKQAQMLGILFAEYGILTTEQASIIRSQMDRPSHVYKNSDSLWAFYNYVTIALQISHPKTWIEDQRVLHYFLDTVNNFPKAQIAVTPTVEAEEEPEFVDPNQLNLLDQIDAAEEEIEEVEVESEFAEEDNFEETVVYTDPVGNTFEAVEVKLPVEPADHDFSQKIELPSIEAHNEFVSGEEPTIDASDLAGEYSLDEMPAVIDKLQEKIDEAKSVENFDLETEVDFSLDEDEDDEEDSSDTIPDFF